MNTPAQSLKQRTPTYINHAELLKRDEQQRKSRANQIIGLRVGIIASILLVWWGLSYFQVIDPLFISDPIAVAISFTEIILEGGFWTDVQATVLASTMGLFAGATLGILAGLILAEVPALRKALQPLIAFANALPRPALAPIFLVWLGLTIWAKVAVSVSIVFFLLLLNTLAGIDSISRDQQLLAKSLNMTWVQRFRMIQLPGARQSILAGLRLAAVYSVLGVVVSEMVAATDGLGVRLVQYTNSFDIAGSFVVIFALAFIAMAFDSLVAWIERRVGQPTANKPRRG